MTYPEFFKALTGFDPNPFQERVAAALLGDKSVVLRAPTGSGKTWAVVAPFLYALHTENPIADRLLYALPLRSLATSLYKSTKCRVGDHEPTRHLFDGVRIQTGEQRKDPLFEGRVTFTTIDQLLSSYLIQPVGLPSRCGNINAGAILGALVCFDEFHLLEPAKSMATAIEMLHTLTVASKLSRFVLMTATLADETLAWLTTKLEAEFIDVPEHEVAKLPSEIGKQRFYRWIDEPLSARAVAQAHVGKRSIVIANTVTRAQELYEELNECRAIFGEQTQIRLLHSRFLTRDRQRIESNLAAWFGPKPTVTDVILVSTQVVEAGLDFSCDNLHTEVAPMNAIVQRAGRCARRAGQTGTVRCYALSVKPSGEPSYGPYKEMRHVVDETIKSLRKAVWVKPQQLVFHNELDMVNRVHTKWELAQLKRFENLDGHRKAVRVAMDGDNPCGVRELVRDIASINVVITDNPDALNFNRRQWPEMLSVPPTSLYQLFKNPQPSPANWIAMNARERDVVQGGAVEVQWEIICGDSDINAAGWLIAVHPSNAFYDADIGLVIGRGGPPKPTEYRNRPRITRYSYSREDYSVHIRRVCAAGARRDGDYRVASCRLAESLRVSNEKLSGWLRLIYQLHDVGKLSVEWQDAIWKSQAAKTGPPPQPRPALAHSDYDPSTDLGRKEARPPHAAEGAYATIPILAAFGDQDDRFVTAALTAIARHHGAFTKQLQSFRLIGDAAQIVDDTLESPQSSHRLVDAPPEHVTRRFDQLLLQATRPSHTTAILLYLYFVRRLRIADQNSFAEP